MIIVAYIILAFTLVQLLVALMNLLPGASLPQAEDMHNERVSVLIPARNEESNIRTLLNDLLKQQYKDIEIIVYDDQSDDNTTAIVKELALTESRIFLLCGGSLPDGWLGKNHACHVLAQKATGRYLLFLDADVRISDNTIGKVVALAKKHRIALISIFPKQVIVSPGERITVPNMNYILLTLLPLILVRRSWFSSLSAANGQFMFFDSGVYRIHQPHLLMKKEKVEDIFIARYLKKMGYKTACLTGDEGIACRMYNGFREAVSGFSKNVIAFFGSSFPAAVLFWLITTFGFIPVLYSFPPLLICVYFGAYILTRIFVSAASRQNIFFNLIFIIPLQLSMGFFIYNAFINKHFRKFQWKGRNIA